jgi:RNA polymerase sigma factor (TIGR02999 family)
MPQSPEGCLGGIVSVAGDSDSISAQGGPSVAGLDAHFQNAYNDLRRIARAQLNQHQRTESLDTTALVHESYLKFVQSQGVKPEDKKHFLAYAAKVMRSVIVDAARARKAERRGGDAVQVTLNSTIIDNVTMESGVLRIDEAVESLQAADPQLAQLVELRFFAGLSMEEAAEAMDIPLRTLYRAWEKARLILMDAIDTD